MRTDRAVTRSDQVANKDEQWPSIHEADCEQNHRRLYKHYLPLRSVKSHNKAHYGPVRSDKCRVYVYLVPVLCVSRWRVSVVAHNSRATVCHGWQSSPDPRTAAWSASPRTSPPGGEEPPSNSARSPSRYSQRGTQSSSDHYNAKYFLVSGRSGGWVRDSSSQFNFFSFLCGFRQKLLQIIS